MDVDQIRRLATELIVTAQAAGRAEMEIYHQDFEVDTKADGSPATAADRVAEGIIVGDLAKIAPDIPVVAEEAVSEGRIPHISKRFFLVDPLDGTKEFIRKSDEFTVNIALIDDGQPVFGLVYAPALSELFVTLGPEEAVMVHMTPLGPVPELDGPAVRRLQTRERPGEGWSVVASKSHMTVETETFLKDFQVSELRNAGSSLKFCLLAKGEADLYPRFGPTMEWDTAAGHAVLAAVGGIVLKTDGQPLSYGKGDEGYRNPFFIAWGRAQETQS